MIKFDSEKETVTIDGTVKDLVFDTVCMVRVIYESLKKNGHEVPAEHYKSLALECIPDAFLDEEAIKKKTEEHHKKSGQMLKEMQDMLNVLKEMHNGIDPNPEAKETSRMSFISGYIARKARINYATDL